jgi:hypothetical protein
MIHVLPNDEQHEYSTTCKCEPKVIKEAEELIIVHNSYDGREGLEVVNNILFNT